jgi:hypothetical protein
VSLTSPPPSARETLFFDRIQTGALPADAFKASGVQIVGARGLPAVYNIEPNMVAPPQSSRVLLIAGDRVTSLVFTFSAPIKRFTIIRIGTTGGASVPTWRMQAYNQEGKVIDSAGEQHGLPKQPQEFAVKGSNIVKVQLDTDNRLGTGTWATWNCLPLVSFGLER